MTYDSDCFNSLALLRLRGANLLGRQLCRPAKWSTKSLAKCGNELGCRDEKSLNELCLSIILSILVDLYFPQVLVKLYSRTEVQVQEKSLHFQSLHSHFDSQYTCWKSIIPTTKNWQAKMKLGSHQQDEHLYSYLSNMFFLLDLPMVHKQKIIIIIERFYHQI